MVPKLVLTEEQSKLLENLTVDRSLTAKAIAERVGPPMSAAYVAKLFQRRGLRKYRLTSVSDGRLGKDS